MANLSIWEKALLIASFILLLHLGYRLIDQSQMLQHFPLDFNNDVSSYMAQLHFLKECGFHQACQYWYNGFTTFQFSPPGWYFVAYPFYLLLQNMQWVAYLSIVISLIAAFFLLWLSSKTAGFSKIKRIAFFTLFFANASAIGNFIRLGRVHELLSWVIFIPFFFLLYQYRDKRLDKKFLLLSILLYAALILTYHSTAVLAGFLWLGFLLTRVSWKEAGKAIAVILAAILLAGFWLFPFVTGIFQESAIPHLKQGSWILDFSRVQLFTNIAVFIIPLACLLAFYLWRKQRNLSRKDALFFLPTIILAGLFLIRLTPFIPIINQIFPDPVIHYLLFFAIFFLLKTEFSSNRIEKLASAAIICIAIASIFVNIIHTPTFVIPDSPREQEFLSYIPRLQERFVLLNYNQLPYNEAFYSLAAIHNKTSLSGWYPEEKTYMYIRRISQIEQAARSKNCTAFQAELEYFNTTEILAAKEFCPFLRECSYTEMSGGNETCFYKLTA